MNMIQLIACAGLITGFFILLRVSPMEFTEGGVPQDHQQAQEHPGRGQ